MKPDLFFKLLIVIAGLAVLPERPAAKPIDSVQLALDRAIAKTRRAIDKYGKTDSAMFAIEQLLADVSAVPGLKTRVKMQPLHGNPAIEAGLLATESDSGVCLIIVKFAAGAATPVHDHTTWGVIRVLDGQDKYASWKKSPGSKDGETSADKQEERILRPGESVYWLEPPHDIHTQHAVDGETWELVMAGKNLLSDIVLKHRHYYNMPSKK